MALNIKDSDTDDLASRVAELSGQSITQAVRSSLEARLAELVREGEQEPRRRFMLDIVHRARERRRAPGDDETPATPEEMLGYDDVGLPG